eukprot:329587-Amphidinium_carterae.1
MKHITSIKCTKVQRSATVASSRRNEALQGRAGGVGERFRGERGRASGDCHSELDETRKRGHVA